MSISVEMAEAAIREANFLRSLGYNPLASCPEHGHPCYPFKDDRDKGQPDWKFSSLSRKSMKCGNCMTNIQVATGSKWNLVVVDVDGRKAAGLWDYYVALSGARLKTWVVSTPRGGRHYWFYTRDPVPYAKKLVGAEGDHELIEVLGEGYLARCPPSVKEVDGELIPYEWVVGPKDIAFPCPLPSWVTVMLATPVAKPKGQTVTMTRAEGKKITFTSKSYDRDAVIRAIPDSDKMQLAASWGLRFDSLIPNRSGFVTCKAIDREDRHPSARFNVRSGWYWDAFGNQLGFFDLAAYFGEYARWQDACNALGNEYGVNPSNEHA